MSRETSTDLPQDLTTVSVQRMEFRRPGATPTAEATALSQRPAPRTEKELFSFGTEVSPTSHRDILYFAQALPSQYFWYDFADISFKLVNGLAQAKLLKASREQNTAVMVEAIAALCDDPQKFYKLSIQDYHYVLYWLRMSSYTSSPWRVPVTCTDSGHRLRVAKGESTAASLTTIITAQRSSFTETTLDIKAAKEAGDRANAVLEAHGLNVRCSYPKVADLLPSLEYAVSNNGIPDPSQFKMIVGMQDEDEQVMSGLSPDVEFILDYAVLIEGVDAPLSLQERAKLIENAGDDVLSALDEYSAAASAYGIQEFISGRCGECGAEKRVRVRISALDFLRSGG